MRALQVHKREFFPRLRLCKAASDPFVNTPYIWMDALNTRGERELLIVELPVYLFGKFSYLNRAL